MPTGTHSHIKRTTPGPKSQCHSPRGEPSWLSWGYNRSHFIAALACGDCMRKNVKISGIKTRILLRCLCMFVACTKQEKPNASQHADPALLDSLICCERGLYLKKSSMIQTMLLPRRLQQTL